MNHLPIRALAFVLILGLGGCIFTLPRPVPEGPDYRFAGFDDEGEMRIDLAKQEMSINGVHSALADCSSERFHCVRALRFGFALVLPKSCAETGAAKWVWDDLETDRTSSFGVTTVGNPAFMVEYDGPHGVTTIYYDPKGELFGPDRKWAHVAYGELQEHGFKLTGSKRLWVCQ